MVTKKLTHGETMLREGELQRLRGLRLMDDDFMTKVFDGHHESVELVLQIILEKADLKVTDAHTQVFVENIPKRSVRLDVVANDSKGRIYNIEIQRADKGAGRKRARYNSSMLDKNILDKGGDFDELSEIYVIFITEKDVMKAGLPVYHIERWIEETKERFDDDEHILYVNGAYRDDTPIGKLMHDFSCTQAEDMNYPVLADRVRYFKETEEGREIMCKAFEEVRNEGRDEGALQNLLKNVKSLMKKMDWSLETTMEMLNVSDTEKAFLVENIKKN